MPNISNVQIYSNAEVYANGVHLVEETSVRVSVNSGHQVVSTVAKGFSGISLGAGMTEISVESAVPSADFDIDPVDYMNSHEVVEMTVFAAGKTYTCKGFFMTYNLNHGVNQESKLDFTFVGEVSSWK